MNVVDERITEVQKKIIKLIDDQLDYKIPLLLLLIRQVSIQWKNEYDAAYSEAISDGLSPTEAEEEASKDTYHSVKIRKDRLWEDIHTDVERMAQKLTESIKSLEDNNSNLQGIGKAINLTAYLADAKNVTKVSEAIEEITDLPEDISSEDLAKMFEYIIIVYSLKSANKGGIYTPIEVIDLLMRLLKPKPNETIYSPSSAYGEFLVRAFQFIKINNPGEESSIALYGEETKDEQYSMSKINLALNRIDNINMSYSNAIIHPGFKVSDTFQKFDIIVTNPEWNQEGFDETALKSGDFWRDRFPFGFTSKSKGDWAWIQHMLACANEDNGRVGIVIDTGALFRTDTTSEPVIRKEIVNRDWIDCVILLPEKLFYSNGGSAGALIFFNKKKTQDRKDKVMFVNASELYNSDKRFGKKKNYLTEEAIDKVSRAYHDGFEEEGFSRLVEKQEIIDWEYNLNVPLYVWKEEPPEDIKVKAEIIELDQIENELDKVRRRYGEIKALYGGDQ